MIEEKDYLKAKQIIQDYEKQLNMSDLELIEDKIIECLNEADSKLNIDDFSSLSESVIDYIDEIYRSKR